LIKFIIRLNILSQKILFIKNMISEKRINFHHKYFDILIKKKNLLQEKEERNIISKEIDKKFIFLDVMCEEA
jgi:hypothetical protein